jgi:hypothetical protein
MTQIPDFWWSHARRVKDVILFITKFYQVLVAEVVNEGLTENWRLEKYWISCTVEPFWYWGECFFRFLAVREIKKFCIVMET